AGGVGDHGHGRDRGEAGDAVRAVFLDGVHVCGGDDVDGFVPAGTDQAAFAAGLLVAAAGRGVVLGRGPGGGRVAAGRGLGGAELFEQHAADIGVAHARGGVGVPGERGAARAAARLVFGPVGADRGIVRGLRLPGDDAVFDVHLPAARAGAV